MKFNYQANIRRYLLGSIIVVTILLLLGGYQYYHHEKQETQLERYNELHAIALLKSKQLTEWHKERLAEVTFFSRYQPFSGYAQEILSGRMEHSGELSLAFLHVMKNRQYENTFIMDRDNRIVFSVLPDVVISDALTVGFTQTVYKTENILFTDFYYCPVHRKVQFEIIAPLANEANQVTGVMVFRIDPTVSLFPLIQEWPTPSRSAETVIIRQDGDSVWYQNDLRNRPNSALQLKFSMDRTEIPAVMAVRGKTGMYEGLDYSGKRVLADLSMVPETSWYMIVKTETSEIYGELNEEMVMIGLITFLSILFFGAVVAWYYYSRQRNIYRELLQKSDELVKSEEEFGTTLYSIGDGVITTDVAGKVRHMNPVAEKYTGWSEKEAVGKEIMEVFHIINEETRLHVENPVMRVLREGKIVGLANHTLLVSRTGMETPIGDSGAPIRDKKGRLIGSVLVFSDQSASQLRRRVMEIRIRLFEYAIRHSMTEVLRMTLDEIGVILSSPIGFFHFLMEDEQTIMVENWSTRTREEFCQTDRLSAHNNLKQAGIWADCIRLRKPVVHNDYENMKGKKGMPEGHVRLIREVVVPIFRNGKIVAVVGVGNKPVAYSEADVEMISFLADVCWEIAEHKMKEDALRHNEEIIRLLFNSTAEGIYGVDLEGNCTFCNRSALTLLGYTYEEEFIGQNMHNLIHHTRADGSPFPLKECTVLRAFTDGIGKQSADEVFWKKDGSSFPVEYWSYPIVREEQVIGSVVTFIDITDRIRMIGELVSAKVKAEESDRLKSAFLANVSHEIRTPMNGILGFLDLLNEPGLDEMERELYMKVMHKSGKRLMDTINDIVEISKIESGQVEIHLEEVDLPQVMDYHKMFFQQIAGGKRLMLAVGQQLKGEGSRVMADKVKVEGILSNLLNNAIKFTEEGGVAFGNYLEGDDLVFWVRDTGIGIPADKHQAIFGRFVQALQPMNSSYEGCGLGLSIVKAYLDKMGGKIWLESEVGKGSTFYFSVPYRPVARGNGLPQQACKEGERQKDKGERGLRTFGPSEGERQKDKGKSEGAAPDAHRTLESPAPNPAPARIKVLIAEDDEIGFQYLKTVLRGHFSQVVHTTTGDEAVRMVREDPDISLVLMDIRMPVMDGLEATREIRKFDRAIPIIAQTAYAFSDDKVQALEAGCDDYITKPINKIELLKIINRAEGSSLREG